MIDKSFSFTGHEAPMYALSYFKDNSFFAGGGDRIVTRIEANENARAIAIVNTNATIYSLQYLPSEDFLLAGAMNGGIHVVDLREKKEIRLLAAHSAGVFDIKYSAKNELIISAGGDGKICFWRYPGLEFSKSLELCKEKVRCIAISSDEKIAAIGCGDGSVRIIDLHKTEQVAAFNAHTLSVNAIEFHPLKNVLLTGGRDAHLKIWELENYTNVESIPAHNYAIYSICFSLNGKIFFTASRDKSIKVWNSHDNHFIQKADHQDAGGHSHSVNKLITFDNWLISCGDDKKIIGWRIKEYSV